MRRRGEHNATWNLRDDAGARFPPGCTSLPSPTTPPAASLCSMNSGRPDRRRVCRQKEGAAERATAHKPPCDRGSAGAHAHPTERAHGARVPLTTGARRAVSYRRPSRVSGNPVDERGGARAVCKDTTTCRGCAQRAPWHVLGSCRVRGNDAEECRHLSTAVVRGEDSRSLELISQPALQLQHPLRLDSVRDRQEVMKRVL
jgi:hypothetical protein